MSSKPIQGTTPGQENAVDIDQLEVDILIICKNPAGFQQTATFLSRRGWPTTVMGNLSKAIDYIVKNQPDFVMISSNHPNPGILRLPMLLKQMNTNCIGFAENSDAASNAKLATMTFKHKLQGLPSGPNVQRMIRKLLMDIYNPVTVREDSEGSEDSNGNDKTVIAGSERKDGSSHSVSTKGAGHQTLGGTEQAINENDESVDAGNYRMGRKKERKRLKDLKPQSEVEESLQSESEKAELLKLAQESEDKARNESSMAFIPSKELKESADEPDLLQEGLKAKDPGSALQEGHGEAKPYRAQESMEQMDRSGSMAQQDAKSRPMNAIDQEGNPGEEKSASQQQENGNGFAARSAKGEIAGQHSALSSEGGDPQNLVAPKTESVLAKVTPVKYFAPETVDATKSKFQELFEKSIESALSKICQSQGNARPLQTVDLVGTLPVDAPELHGYLVICAAGVEPDQQLEFLQIFRAVLSMVMSENGIRAKLDEGFVVIQEPFEFMAWSKQEADLCLTSEHKGNQVGVSFLRTEERFSEPSTGKQDMARISVEEINTDQLVPFKAYLHFKQSDRFFLYLRNGRRLYKKQKDRLLDRKVSDFYIKSVDIKNYKTYSAANFISQSLRRVKPRRAS